MKHQISLKRFLAMIGLSFIFMYGLMYAMANSFSDIYFNLNQLYMVGLMIVPMVILEVIFMDMPLGDKKNIFLFIAGNLILFVLFWLGLRQQTFISDKQFIRSMIPHHSGAVLMCQKAVLKDPELKTLCRKIITGQESEISQMKGILLKLDQ